MFPSVLQRPMYLLPQLLPSQPFPEHELAAEAIELLETNAEAIAAELSDQITVRCPAALTLGLCTALGRRRGT